MVVRTFKPQAVATLLQTSTDTIRRDVEEAGIEVQRQEGSIKQRLFTIENIYDLARFRAKKNGKSKAKRPIVITVYAPKGGVGKTTTSVNLACLFPFLGLRTLAADIDFQSNMTLSFGYDSELTKEEAEEAGLSEDQCIEYHIGHLLPKYPGGSKTLDEVLKKPYGENGPHLIPSELSLDNLDMMFAMEALNMRRPERVFNDLLTEARAGKTPGIDLSQYDVIIFDAPPAKNRVTMSALLASDFVLAPISLEKFSTKAVSYLASVLTDLNKEFGRNPELIIMANFFDQNRPRVLQQLSKIRTAYEDYWLDASVRRSEDFPKSLSSDEYELPLSLSKISSTGATDLRVVAEVLVKRMGVFE